MYPLQPTCSVPFPRNLLIMNKEGVRVTSANDQPDGLIQLRLEETRPHTVEIEVCNDSQEEALNLLHCEMLRKVRVFSLDDTWKVTEGQSTHCMPPGRCWGRSQRDRGRSWRERGESHGLTGEGH